MNIVKEIRKAANIETGRATLTGSVGGPITGLNNLSTATVNMGTLIGQPQHAGEFINEGYRGNSTVYSIVSEQAEKFGSIPVNVFKRTSDADYKTLREFERQNKWGDPRFTKKWKELRAKALKPADNHPLAELLKRPNPKAGQSSFFEYLFGFKLNTGAGAFWANTGGIPGGEPLELWVLPTPDLNIVCKSPQYMIPVGYQLQNGMIANLRYEDVLYWAFPNYNMDRNGSHLYGMAPLTAASIDLLIQKYGKKAALSLLLNQGSKGVVYRNSQETTFDENEKDQLQVKFNQKINGTENAGRIEVANAQLGYINLGMDFNSMGIAALRDMTKEDIANVFHHPFPLLSSKDGTYSNMQEARKQLVTGVIIPAWMGLRDELNTFFQNAYKDRTLFIDPDFSLLAELQPDLNQQSQAIQRLVQIGLPPNDALSYLGFEVDETNEAMNANYIASGFTRVDDVYSGVQQDMQNTIDQLNADGANDYNDNQGNKQLLEALVRTEYKGHENSKQILDALKRAEYISDQNTKHLIQLLKERR